MNQNNKPLLSVAIPTKNRQYYCIEVIKHILSYNNNDFELVIQDNSDDRTIEEFVSTIEDKRLKYVYTDEAISSVENMSRSIALTSGEYVCMIGDDDIILPSIFEYAKYMKKNDIESVSMNTIPSYTWPNIELNIDGKFAVIKSKQYQKIRKIQVKKQLIQLYKDGIIDYQNYSLPRVYHGIIKKTILDKINKQIGYYFGGLSPDIYSTIALSSLISKHIIVDDFFTISGACPQSTTAQSKLGGHKGKLSDAPHFNNNSDYKWDKLIPEYYSVETIWAETAIKCARDFNLNECLDSFNLKMFNIVFYLRNKDIIDFMPYICCLSLFGLSYKLKYYIKRIYQKIFCEKKYMYSHISDISSCFYILYKKNK